MVGVAGFEPATTRTPSVKLRISQVSLGNVGYASNPCRPRVFSTLQVALEDHRKSTNSTEGTHKSPHTGWARFCVQICTSPSPGERAKWVQVL